MITIKENTIKEKPLGVKIIAILYWVGSAFAVLAALLLFVGSGFVIRVAMDVPWLAALGTGLFIVVGILLLALAALGIFVGWGLWRLKNWARITAIVLAAISIVTSLGAIFSGDFSSIVGIIIHGVIIWYLGFNEEVKALFS